VTMGIVSPKGGANLGWDVAAYGPLAARVLLDTSFFSAVCSSYSTSLERKRTCCRLESSAESAARMALLIEVLGGLALIGGYLTRLSSSALAFYLVPVTLMLHDF
jgi:uncharacterized membrane protein YphA (DoxX/SURF4 family)